MTKQYGFYYNGSACIGCKACMSACKDKNNLPVGINWRRVHQYGGGGWIPSANDPELMIPNNMFVYSMSIACNHCEHPLCLQVCPAQAIQKREDGIVLIDQNQCIGCRYCEWACPYGAPQFNEEEGHMTKCNFCEDLIAQGQNPACVDACVMRAIEFGELDELRAKYGDVNAVEPLPSAEYTNPSIVITPHKDAQLTGQGTGAILDPFTGGMK
jgi:anaerobic dimethyl sulfoxide reductase subunit B (iron-sulfur subunit)